jgi:hypothetical protein
VWRLLDDLEQCRVLQDHWCRAIRRSHGVAPDSFRGKQIGISPHQADDGDFSHHVRVAPSAAIGHVQQCGRRTRRNQVSALTAFLQVGDSHLESVPHTDEHDVDAESQ